MKDEIRARYLQFAELVARCPWPLLEDDFYDPEDGCMCGTAALAVFDGLADTAALETMHALLRDDIYWWHTGVTSPLARVRDTIVERWWIDVDTIVDVADRPSDDDATDARRRVAEWFCAWAIEEHEPEDEELAQHFDEDRAWEKALKEAQKIVAGWMPGRRVGHG